ETPSPDVEPGTSTSSSPAGAANVVPSDQASPPATQASSPPSPEPADSPPALTSPPTSTPNLVHEPPVITPFPNTESPLAMSLNVNKELLTLAESLDVSTVGKVLQELLNNGVHTKEALHSVAKDPGIKCAIAEKLNLKSRVTFSIMCNRVESEYSKQESKETGHLNSDDMTKLLMNFQQMNGS
ncbi:hypothetical protein FOL47_005105, partial [Perkinsus chesapeaki]